MRVNLVNGQLAPGYEDLLLWYRNLFGNHNKLAPARHQPPVPPAHLPPAPTGTTQPWGAQQPPSVYGIPIFHPTDINQAATIARLQQAGLGHGPVDRLIDALRGLR